jgi:hypothetical protein
LIRNLNGRAHEDVATVGHAACGQLRAYERSRLRYYYAIAECDSVRTAAHIYKECDGTEYEPTGNKLDLRYVPQGTTFDDREARDVAMHIPDDYSPPDLNQHTLQHTKVCGGAAYRALCSRRGGGCASGVRQRTTSGSRHA